jgi:hypothetical protein
MVKDQILKTAFGSQSVHVDRCLYNIVHTLKVVIRGMTSTLHSTHVHFSLFDRTEQCELTHDNKNNINRHNIDERRTH